jgi:hypothetical protein
VKKFVKKPVFVLAEQWLGTEEQLKRLLSEGVIIEIPSRDGSVLIPTLQGNLTCNLGDYIVLEEGGSRSVYAAVYFESQFEEDSEKGSEASLDASLGKKEVIGEVEKENIIDEVMQQGPVVEAEQEKEVEEVITEKPKEEGLK